MSQLINTMSKTQPPNFLFIFPDQHRGDWLPYPDEIFKKLGMEPIPIRMPNLEQLMNLGVTFPNTVTPSPLCAPARSCLASGVRYCKTGVLTNSFNHPLDKETFYSVLKKNGYTVGGCGKFDLRKPEHNFNGTGWVPKMEKLGFTKGYAIDNGGKHDAVRCGTTYVDEDGKRQRYKNPEEHEPVCPYMKYLKDNGLMMVHVNDFKKRRKMFGIDLATFPTELPEEAYCDNWVGRNGIDIIKRFPKEKPWFLQVNFVCPHEPWDVTKRMREAWKDEEFPPPVANNELIAPEENKVRQNYAAMLENIDRNMGFLINAIKERGELDNTIIIYSSDHGEMLGDFTLYGKSKYQRGSTRVPLVIGGPGIKDGLICEKLVEMQDLTSTIIDYAGLEMADAKDSRSLRPLLEGLNEEHRKYQVSALSPKNQENWKIISDGKYKLVAREGAADLLYDIEEDPWELKDIASAQPEVIERLKIALKNGE